MPERIGPKRVRSLKIEDFSKADRHLLRQAFLSHVPMVLVGGLETERPHIISMGHPDGLADPKTIPEGSRYYSLRRIKGVGVPEESCGPAGRGL